ncbi:endonuclease [Bacillus kexueae]|uniref:endonuclease n=1 Tax=Aeribacillus kexueae TaxID=2078952 RepID=UPI001FAE83F9|nr:endonuclease [Bacillus kexueae]
MDHPLDSFMMEMVFGKLLGDGNLTIDESRSPRFRFAHSLKDKEWCVHCYEQLNNHLPMNAPKYRKLNDPRVNKGYKEQLYVQSKTHPFFIRLKNQWYLNKKKVVPINELEKYFTPLCLAWWYQDDGHLKITNQQLKKVILSTESFTEEEILSLKELLKNKFCLEFKKDGQNRLIIYDKPQIYYFLHLIKPYIHRSMERKCVFPKMDKPIEKTHLRTTIYLPSHIKLASPSQDIKEIISKLKQSFLPMLENRDYIIQYF